MCPLAGKTKDGEDASEDYTLEFKQEVVPLVESGQRISEVARSLGIVEQTLSNWVNAEGSVEALHEGIVGRLRRGANRHLESYISEKS